MFSQVNTVFEYLGKEVNSKYDEINPLISPDGKTLYFSRKNHPENSHGPINTTDIWYSTLDESGNWTNSKRLKAPFNQAVHNGLFGISPDGNTFIIQGSYKNGKYEGVGLSVIRKTKKGWSDPSKLDIKGYDKLNKGYYSGAFLCNDGNTILLYFSETKNDRKPDLYATFREMDNSWTKPQHLGPTLNSQYLDAAPFLASDNKTLYFCSTRPGGLGNADIYKSYRLDDTWNNWSTPENLGSSINTKNRETYYTLSASGDFAYLVSTGEAGKTDIVKVKLTDKQKPEPVVLIYGRVLNAITGEPIEAGINYEILKNGKEAGSATSDPENGAYKIVLPKGESYGLSAISEGFLPVSEHLDLINIIEYKEIKKDLLLMPIEKGQSIVLNNIFFETGNATLQPESEPEIARLSKILQKHPSLFIEIAGHTDDVGDEIMNQKLSVERALSVKKALVEKGVNAKRINTKGYGESKPVTSNETEEGKAQNRRVEFLILKN